MTVRGVCPTHGGGWGVGGAGSVFSVEPIAELNEVQALGFLVTRDNEYLYLNYMYVTWFQENSPAQG